MISLLFLSLVPVVLSALPVGFRVSVAFPLHRFDWVKGSHFDFLGRVKGDKLGPLCLEAQWPQSFHQSCPFLLGPTRDPLSGPMYAHLDFVAALA